MEQEEFIIEQGKIDYRFSEQKARTFFSEQYDGGEVPSVFYLHLKYEDEIYLPLCIFRRELAPLQAIVKYLRENLGMKNQKIAGMLGRDPRTIWLTYKAVEKKKTLLVGDTKFSAAGFDSSAPREVPLNIFKNRKLSALESLTGFLKNQGLNYSEIARQLGKDPRTIWTVHSRMSKKLGDKGKTGLSKKQVERKRLGPKKRLEKTKA